MIPYYPFKLLIFFMMRNLRLLSFAFLLLGLFTGTQALAQNLDSKGTDFWIMFNENTTVQSFELFITGDVSTSGTVSVPGLGLLIPFTVTANAVTTVSLPATVMVSGSETTINRGVNITANDEVTVYGLNQAPFTTDAFLALPIDVLGTTYKIMSYTPLTSFGLESQFGVVGTENNTVVTIIPSVSVGSRIAGVPYIVVLDAGEAYQFQAAGTNEDLTGTEISSDKPVAVFGSHVCAFVPPGQFACDHLVEQMPPTDTWGNQFVTAPLAQRTGGDIFRILADESGTVVNLSGVNGFSQTLNLSSGQFEELDVPSSEFLSISSNKPILVAQYSKGVTVDNTTGDPFMLLIPPFEQFQNDYTVTTPATGFSANFINVVARTSEIGTITLDGVVIPAGDFTPITGTIFSAAQLSVALGTHNLSGNLGFGVSVYGFNNADSYGYLGGQAFAEVAVVTSLVVSVPNQTVNAGDVVCIDATVTDQDGDPVAGVGVTFSVSGANTAAGLVATDANGVATYCYVATNPGTDVADASFSTFSDQGTITVNAVSAVPAAPTNLVVVNDSSFIVPMDWDDNATDEDGYKVIRTINGVSSVIATLGPDATAYQDTIQLFGQTISYEVVAFNGEGDSSPSNTDTYAMPTLIPDLSIDFVCYNPNTDMLTWEVTNPNAQWHPYVWAQWWSMQHDTLWANPGTSTFMTVNNPQNPSTWGDDNITGVWWADETLTPNNPFNVEFNAPLGVTCSVPRTANPGFTPVAGGPSFTGMRGQLDIQASMQQYLAASIQIGPNPVQNALQVSTEMPIEGAQIVVMNSVGQTMVQQSADLESTYKLNMSELAAGVYMVSVRVSGIAVTQRIVKL